MTNTTRFQPKQIHHEVIAECLAEAGMTALDVARATGIALPKILRLMGLASGPARSRDELDGLELVQLCMLAGVPLSSVVEDEFRPS